MTTKSITINLSALRASTVDGAMMKLLAWLADGSGYEVIEGVLIDGPGPRYQLGDGTAWPASGVGWRVLEYGDGPPAGYRLGVKSLKYGGKHYLQGQMVSVAVYTEMPPSVKAFWEPTWVL